MKMKRYTQFTKKIILRKYLMTKCDGDIAKKTINKEAILFRNDVLSDYKNLFISRGLLYDRLLSGSIKEQETSLLWNIIVERKPSVVLQVGTFVGYSSIIIAEALRYNGAGILYSVDPEVMHRGIANPVDIAREITEKRGLEKYVKFIRGWFSNCLGIGLMSGNETNNIQIVSQSLLKEIAPLDFVFIDGDHTTLSCINDFVAVKDFLGNNSIVAFHDSNKWYSVMLAIKIIINDEIVKKYFKMDALWKENGLFLLERTLSEKLVLLEILVRDAISKKPIPNAQLIYKKKKIIIRTTGTDGKVYFEPIYSGKYQIDIEAKGYQTLVDYTVLIDINQLQQKKVIEMEVTPPSSP